MAGSALPGERPRRRPKSPLASPTYLLSQRTRSFSTKYGVGPRSSACASCIIFVKSGSMYMGVFGLGIEEGDTPVASTEAGNVWFFPFFPRFARMYRMDTEGRWYTLPAARSIEESLKATAEYRRTHTMNGKGS